MKKYLIIGILLMPSILIYESNACDVVDTNIVISPSATINPTTTPTPSFEPDLRYIL